MSRRLTVPSYRLHRQSGQAIVTLPDGLGNRRDVLLGQYGTPESRAEYLRVLAEWEAAGRRLPPRDAGAATPPDISVNELCLAYWRHVETYYVKGGKPTSEQHPIKQALRYVKQLYGHTPAKDFGPQALKAVRQKMIDHPVTRRIKVEDADSGEARWEERLLHKGLARRTINKLVGRIKRMFGWAVEEELLPAEVHQALLRVKGLRKGKGQGREKPRVKPVADSLVEATLPHLPAVVRAMVQAQRLTGMRPQEVVGLRPVDIDMAGAVWEYRPSGYKTEHHNEQDDPDRERVVFIGPRAQEILKPWLPPAVHEWFFSPARSEEARNAKRRQERRSPMTPSQACRRPKAGRRRPPRDRYDVASYRRAVRRACLKAGVPVWYPNQLRHARGTEVRKRYGLEAAQAVLGHAELGVTQVYAEADREAARRVVREIG
jgi:integrase